MPYIQVDLDVYKKAPSVARLAGVPEHVMLGGLALMWNWAFCENDDNVTEDHLAGFFGARGVAGALQTFGFLEAKPEGFRVKGMGRYRKAREAKKRGAAAANAKRWGKAAKPVAEASQLRQSCDTPAVAEPSQNIALEPRADNREPITENKEVEEETAPSPKQRVREKLPESPGADFYRWFQDARLADGFVVEEQSPGHRKISVWYSEALSHARGDDTLLRRAAIQYSGDEYWRERGLPFNGFMAQWSKYVSSVPTETRRAL